MPHILHLTNGLNVGGTEKTALAYSLGLKGEGIRSTLGGFNHDGLLSNEAASHGVESVCFHGNPNEFAEYVQRESVEVLHIHSGFKDADKIAILAKKIGVKKIYLTSYFGWYDELSSLDDIDRYLFASKFSQARFARLSKLSNETISKKFSIIYPPIYLPKTKDFCHIREEVRKSLNLDQNAVLIGRVGRADTTKLDDFILKSFRLARSQCKEIHLAIIGDSSLKFSRRAEKMLGRSISIIDSSLTPSEITCYLAGMDIMAHTSHVGECPEISVLEGMAMKLPIVAQDTPQVDYGLPELISYGINGYLEPTVEKFAIRIIELAQDVGLRKLLANGSGCIFNKFFKPDFSLSKYLELVNADFSADCSRSRVTIEHSINFVRTSDCEENELFYSSPVNRTDTLLNSNENPKSLYVALKRTYFSFIAWRQRLLKKMVQNRPYDFSRIGSYQILQVIDYPRENTWESCLPLPTEVNFQDLPPVSVAISTFNNERTIEYCLRSVRSQIYPQDKIEIVVADGGSKDRTIEFCKNYGCKIIHNEKVTEKGFDGGKNRSINATSNEIIVVLDADNVFSSPFLMQELVIPIISRPDVVSVTSLLRADKRWNLFERYYANVYDPVEFNFTPSCEERTFQGATMSSRYIQLHRLPGEKIYVGNGTAIRRTPLIEIGGYDYDLETGIRLSYMGKMLLSSRSIIYHHNALNARHYVRKKTRSIRDFIAQFAIRSKENSFSETIVGSTGTNSIKFIAQILAGFTLVFPAIVAIKSIRKYRDISFIWNLIMYPIISAVYMMVLIKEFKHVMDILFRHPKAMDKIGK